MKLKSCHVIYIFIPFSLYCETQNICVYQSQKIFRHSFLFLNLFITDYSFDLMFFFFFSSIAAEEESQPSPIVAMLISGLKGLLVKYWILFCCSMFFVVSFSGKVFQDTKAFF